MVSLLFPLVVIVIIIFLIAGIMQNKLTEKKSSLVRSIYFYLTSLVTLGIVVGSLIFLINVGLKAWVFPEADTVYYRLGPPSMLYLSDISEKGELSLNALSCEDGCSLTETQKNNIETWKSNYNSWLDSKNNPKANLYNDLAAALAFLIVALPFYIIHFRIVQKDAKIEEADGDGNVIRPTYFYFVSLSALIMIVVSGGMLINLGLKNWVFPGAKNNNKYIESPAVSMVDEKAPVQSLINCANTCGVSEENVTLAKQWIVDYEEWEKSDYKSYDNNQRQAAVAIPYLIIGIPLFWYHWNIARNKRRKKKEKFEDNKEE